MGDDATTTLGGTYQTVSAWSLGPSSELRLEAVAAPARVAGLRVVLDNPLGESVIMKARVHVPGVIR